MLASDISAYEDRVHKQILSHIEIYQFHGIDIYRLKSTYSSGYYYQKEVKKKSVVLHFTAGYLNGDINALTTKNYHVSVPFVIARNGKIYQLHDPKYWSYHLGPAAIGGNETCSSQTIGIEISNIGPLTLKGKTLYTYTGSKYCELSETAYYQKVSYRNKSYYATFTKAQYQTLKKLLSVISQEFDIPYKFLPLSKRYSTFSTNSDAQNFTGICSHVNFRTDKFDIGPGFDWNCLNQLYLPTCELSEINLNKTYQQIDTASLNHFPITSYGWWHNGIHLLASQKTPIFAISDGQIVYSRISSETHGENGSSNFVLIQHQLTIHQTEITFYVLYMHLIKLNIHVKIKDKTEENSLPPWIIQKFYKKKGIITDVYTDKCVSMYSDNNGKPSKIELFKLIKGDEFDIINDAVKYGRYEITKIKYNEKTGWIYNRDNKGKKYSRPYLTLHNWAIDSNQNPREDIFQDTLSYEQPVNVYCGQIVGYTSEGLSHVEILKRGTVFKKKSGYCHVEIFSRHIEHGNKNLYDVLKIQPAKYILFEDVDNDILEPKKERISLLRECQKKVPEIEKYNNNKSILNINKEDFKRFIVDHLIKLRDSVAFHISSWQAIGERIKLTQYPSIEELGSYYLFKPSDKKLILNDKEKLFFYHPIRFIEILNEILNPDKILHEKTSDETSEPIVKQAQKALSISGPEKANVFDKVEYQAFTQTTANNMPKNSLNTETLDIDWIIKIKSNNTVIKKINTNGSTLEYHIPIKTINETIVVSALEKRNSLEANYETIIEYAFSGDVYWAARDLDSFFLGNHHFIIIKFDNLNSANIFRKIHDIGYNSQNSEFFITVAAFEAENGNLECEFNQKTDVHAVKEHISPYLKEFFADYSLERDGHIVNPPGTMSSQQFIERIVSLSNTYIENQRSRHIEYTLANYNCAAWVNTLFKKIGVDESTRLKKGEFDGFDWGEEDSFNTLNSMFEQ